MAQPEKRLYRSRDERMLTGLLGGVAQYLGADPSLVRIGYVLVTLFTGCVPGLIFYFVFALIVPKAPEAEPSRSE